MGHGKYIAPPKGEYQVGAGERLDLQYIVLPGESREIEITFARAMRRCVSALSCITGRRVARVPS